MHRQLVVCQQNKLSAMLPYLQAASPTHFGCVSFLFGTGHLADSDGWKYAGGGRNPQYADANFCRSYSPSGAGLEGISMFSCSTSGSRMLWPADPCGKSITSGRDMATHCLIVLGAAESNTFF